MPTLALDIVLSIVKSRSHHAGSDSLFARELHRATEETTPAHVDHETLWLEFGWDIAEGDGEFAEHVQSRAEAHLHRLPHVLQQMERIKRRQAGRPANRPESQ